MNLKELRLKAVELDGKINACDQAVVTADAEINALREKVTAEKRAMTDDERARLKVLGDVKATQRDFKASFLDEKKALMVDLAAAEEANDKVKTESDPGETPEAKAARLANGNTRIEVVDMTKKQGYFGAQLQAVRRTAIALKEGHQASNGDRDLLKSMNPHQGMQAAATGLNTDVPSEGGFLVAPERSNVILQRAYATGAVLSRVNRMPIGAGSNGMVINAIDETSRANGSRYGGIVSTWVGQGNSVTAGKPTFRAIDLKLRKVMATVYATDEQLTDAVALEAWVNKYLPLELQYRTEDAVLNGIGGNQPLGVLNNPAVLSLTRSSSARILGEDLRGMVNRMWAPLWGGAAFFVDQSTLGEFDQLGIAQGTGAWADPSYRAAGSTPGQQFATYKNIPIIPVEYCAALGTSGDIVLVNLDEYVLIDKGGVDQAVSIHVAFLTDEQVFRFIYRVDGQLTWNSALTPKSAGATLSCALVLSTL